MKTVKLLMHGRDQGDGSFHVSFYKDENAFVDDHDDEGQGLELLQRIRDGEDPYQDGYLETVTLTFDENGNLVHPHKWGTGVSFG